MVDFTEGGKRPWPGPPLRKEITAKDRAATIVNDAVSEIKTGGMQVIQLDRIIDAVAAAFEAMDRSAPALLTPRQSARHLFVERDETKDSRGDPKFMQLSSYLGPDGSNQVNALDADGVAWALVGKSGSMFWVAAPTERAK